MSRRLGNPLLGTVTLAVLGAAGCGNGAATFNNHLVESARKVVSAVDKFHKAVDAAANKGGDVAGVQKTHAELTSTVAAAKKEAADLKPPTSASGQKLAEGYRRFVQLHDDLANQPFGEVVKILENPKRTPADLIRIQTLFADARQKTEGEVRALDAVQREFVREHKLKIQSPAK